MFDDSGFKNAACFKCAANHAVLKCIQPGAVKRGIAILGGELAIFALLIKAGNLEEIDEAVILTPIIKANPVTFGLITRLQVEHGRRAKHPDHWRRSPRADHICQRFAVKMIKRQAHPIIIIWLPDKLGKASV